MFRKTADAPLQRVLVNCRYTEYPVDTGKRARSMDEVKGGIFLCSECHEDHPWGPKVAWLESPSS